MARILCVWSPNWAIANWRRRNPCASPAEARAPFSLVATERGVRRLYAVDETAAAQGFFVGQKATDAAALNPDILTGEADPAADEKALEALCQWCVRFSPAVAMAPPDGLFLDITGVAHLWGGERNMAGNLIARMAANGLPAKTAAAGTAGAAWALAHWGDWAETPILAAPGAEAELLAPLPVTALRLEAQTAAQIERLGLTSIGHLIATPRSELTRRFGPQVIERLNQALGQAQEALVFRRPATPWFARLAFVEPISTPEDLARVTSDITGLLCARLETAGLGAGRFELAFHRMDGRAESLAVGLALPAREAGRIAALFRLHLEEVDPGFGVEVVTLAAHRVAPLHPRQGRLDEEGIPQGGLAPLIDQLSNRLGEDRVWRDEAFPSHAPERAVVRRPPLNGPGEKRGWDGERPRPVRLFRRPEPIEAVAPVPDDPPLLFRWRGLSHRIRRAEGPERLAEEWWRAPFAEASPDRVRDYYRVEDEAGARFWLFREGVYEAGSPARWWMHGLFG